MIRKTHIMGKYGKSAKLVAGYVQLHVRIGVPGRYPGLYFVFCEVKLVVI